MAGTCAFSPTIACGFAKMTFVDVAHPELVLLIPEGLILPFVACTGAIVIVLPHPTLVVFLIQALWEYVVH